MINNGLEGVRPLLANNPPPYCRNSHRYNNEPLKELKTYINIEKQHDNAKYIKKINKLDPTIRPISKLNSENRMKDWRSDYDNPYKYIPHINYNSKISLGFWDVEDTGYSNFNINKFFK